MIFDPITSRRNAFTEGMLRFLLETKYESSRPMGNVAQSNLGTVIKAWLVGLGTTVAPREFAYSSQVHSGPRRECDRQRGSPLYRGEQYSAWVC